MKKLFFVLIILSLGLNSCGDDTEYNEKQEDTSVVVDKEALLAEVADLDAKIAASPTPDPELLKKAVSLYQDYAGVFPEDPKSPDYLLKASDFAMALNQPEKSVKLLNKIIAKYPKYSRMEDVMYVKASHLDLNLRDTTRAKEAYYEFMEAYPNSELIDDCESRIKNIKYSIEELAEIFIKDLEAGAN